MGMLMEGFLEYSRLAIVLCWLPVILVIRQAAVKTAIVRSILLAAVVLVLAVGMASLRLVRPEHPLTGVLVSLLSISVYRWGKDWQARTLLFDKRLALSPTLYPPAPQPRDSITIAVTLVNAWLVLVWSQLLEAYPLPTLLPFNYRVWYSAGAVVAILAWFALGSWGGSQLGLYLETRLKFPNAIVGGLLRALAVVCGLTTLYLIVRSIMAYV